MRRTGWAFACACALLAGCRREESASTVGAASAQAKPPNVVWLSIESLRADHVGCYGYARPTTPHLDALAEESTVFTRADSVTSWTLTSHASMFTGLYPSAHQVIRPKDRLADEHVTVAEGLRDAGYQTAAVVSGPYLAKPYNLQQGFTYVDDSAIQHMKGASADVTNPDLEEAVVKFLRAKRDASKPLMLFLYYWDTHSEFIPPPPYDTMFVPPGAKPIKKVQYMPAFKLGRHMTRAQLDWLVAQYDGEIRCTDDYIGRVFGLLRELGLWENTLIIVTADHGEEFYEHGCNSHKHTLYVESEHVPLIVKWPAATSAAVGAQSDEPVSLVDLYPTIFDVAGRDAPAVHNGRSLRAAIDDERPVFLELETLWSYTQKSTGEKWLERTAWTAVRQGGYKLVHIEPLEDRAGKDLSPRWELYDCVADPGEQHPLGDAQPERYGELQGRIAEWRAAMAVLARRWEPGGPARLTEEQVQRLRALGYIP